jgi:hypothetical protein
MKEYIKKPRKKAISEYIYGLDLSDMAEKLDEVIDYLNGVISVGLLPVPDGYKEDEK